MSPLVFLSSLVVLVTLYLVWGVTKLPGEGWQIAAAVPLKKGVDGSWIGVNLTWYGILTANAYLVASLLALVLMGSAGISLRAVLFLVFLLVGCCVPASRLVAQLVERKANTFTVGGAVFVGTLVAPWLVQLVNITPLGDDGALVPALPALAAMSIAYAFGEGLGRLACVSFGCCYGKPLSACHPTLARIISPVALTFTGKTKKIAYASKLDGIKVVPIQGFTYVLYCATGIAATLLFLGAHYGASFLLALGVTQGWRVISEFFRDDYRGAGKISAYQVMGLMAIAYGFGTVNYFGAEPVHLADLSQGFKDLWSPAPLLALQLLWLTIFLYTGVSRVTAATMSFHVDPEKI